jgi:hypothetical protein
MAALLVGVSCISGVSPNVVGALVPAVRASLENAVFAFGSVKKAASTQKSPQHYRLARNRFKFVVNALHLGLCVRFHAKMTWAATKSLKVRMSSLRQKKGELACLTL